VTSAGMVTAPGSWGDQHVIRRTHKIFRLYKTEAFRNALKRARALKKKTEKDNKNKYGTTAGLGKYGL